MDRINMKQTFVELATKYKYVLLIFAVGLVLMLLPESDSPAEVPKETVSAAPGERDMEARLSQILSEVKGAGEVQVLLTYAAGQETIYQTDEDVSEKEGSVSSKTDTVTVTDSDRNQSGLIQRIDPPVYLGALVVCQGADHPAVKLAIVEAISKATGLGADKICVLKMK